MCKKLLSAVVLVAISMISSAQAQSLIGYWPFDNDLQDASGGASAGAVFVGTEQYSTTVPAGVASTHSFDFDGLSRVDLPFMDFYNTAHSTGATLSMWLNAAPQNDNRIFAEACNTGGCRSFYGLGSDNGVPLTIHGCSSAAPTILLRTIRGVLRRCSTPAGTTSS